MSISVPNQPDPIHYGILKFTEKSRVQGTGITFIPLFSNNQKIIVRSRLKNQHTDMWAKVHGDELLEILGPVGDFATEKLVFQYHFNILSLKYPQIDINQLRNKKVNSILNKSEMKAFTIDGSSTLDRDDAISYHEYKDHYEIGIHIIDTTKIINADLFKWAQKRTSSAYWGNGTSPMLPPELAHEILSLNIGHHNCISLFLKYSYDNILLEKYMKNVEVHITDNFTYQNFNSDGNYNSFVQKIQALKDNDKENDIEDLVAWLMIQYNLYMTQTFIDKKGLFLRVQKDNLSPALYQFKNEKKENNLHSSIGDIYGHFTSPIRRFADMNNQFVINDMINDSLPTLNLQTLNDRMLQIKLFHYHITLTELAYKFKDEPKVCHGQIKSGEDGKYLYIIINEKRFKIPTYDSYQNFNNFQDGNYMFEIFGIIKNGRSSLRIRLCQNLEHLESTMEIKSEISLESTEKSSLETISTDSPHKIYDFDSAKQHIEFLTGYPIDTFQENCLKTILDDHDLIGMAPTGSGKTLIALIAIILKAFDQKKRAILTTPIKALSNQKYHEFTTWIKKITDKKRITLLTGDIQARATPSGGDGDLELLIMTSEILTNKLDHSRQTGKLDPDLENVSVVVMDEIHYINDPHRGHVWERSIMSLPKNIQIVALSATLSDPQNFADWMSVRRPTKIIQRTDRHVPLYVGGYDNDKFIEIMNTHSSSKKLESSVYSNLYKNSFLADNKLFSLIRTLDKQDKLPGIIFMMSRKKCIEMASLISWNLLVGKRPEEKEFHDEYDFLYQKEEYEYKVKNIINHQHKLINKYLGPYQEILNKINGYHEFLKMIENGVAYHHAGMLPILREFVEILFQNRLLKVVFATETLGVGINMPARTVVLTQLNKPTGSDSDMRNLRTDEFWQMSGRAGRRGIDTQGFVIYFPLHKPLSELELRQILFGSMPVANSQLKINKLFVLKYITEDPNIIFNKTLLNHGYIKDIVNLKKELNNLPVFDDEMNKDLLRSQKLQDKINDNFFRPTPKQLKTYKKELSEIEKKYENFQKQSSLLQNRRKLEDQIVLYENILTDEWNMSKEWLLSNVYIKEDNIYTSAGLISSNLSDGSPLVRGKIIANGDLSDFTFAEIVAWLASFTEDVRLSSSVVDELPLLSKNFETVYDKSRKLADDEDETIYYNTSVLIHEWVKNKDIYYISRFMDISHLGIFVKVILRVISYIDELKKILLGMEQFELYNLLENHHEKLLSNIVTNKSLYI